MEPTDILRVLDSAEDLPRDALRAAGEQRAQMLPLFIERIDSYARRASEADDNALFFIFHLLGSWKETAAYRPLSRLLASDPEHLDRVLGMATTETAHRVMAGVFDGDPSPLYNVILDTNVDEFIRSRLCETLAMLVVEGRLDRADATAFLRDCWVNLHPREANFVWVGWQSAIAVLGLAEFVPLVRQAFDAGFIDRSWQSFGDFMEDYEHAIENPCNPWPQYDKYTPFGDTADELAGWYCFSEEARRRHAAVGRVDGIDYSPYLAPLPAHNPLRGVGRNDPCPCGSGKKYKKCCLQ